MIILKNNTFAQVLLIMQSIHGSLSRENMGISRYFNSPTCNRRYLCLFASHISNIISESGHVINSRSTRQAASSLFERWDINQNGQVTKKRRDRWQKKNGQVTGKIAPHSPVLIFSWLFNLVFAISTRLYNKRKFSSRWLRTSLWGQSCKRKD